MHIFIILLTLMVTGFLKATELKNIKDYVTAIPIETLGLYDSKGTLISSQQLSKRLKNVDLRNGWLEIDTKSLEAFESPIQVALFKRKVNSPLIALAYQKGGSTDNLVFYSVKDGKWNNITDEVFPKIDLVTIKKYSQMHLDPRDLKKFSKDNITLNDCASGTYKYVLPKVGTTIIAKVSSDCVLYSNDKTLFEFKFDGEKFALSSK